MVPRLTLVIFLLVLTGFAGCTSPAKPAPEAPLSTPALATPTAAADPFTGERVAMVHEQIAGRGVRDSAVLAAPEQGRTPSICPGGVRTGRLRRPPLAHRLRPDHLAAIHRRFDE